MSKNEPTRLTAVSLADFKDYGCPHCGQQSGYIPAAGKGGAIWYCKKCKKISVLLAKGVNKSPFGTGAGSRETFTELEDHPRRSSWKKILTPEKKIILERWEAIMSKDALFLKAVPFPEEKNPKGALIGEKFKEVEIMPV